KPSRNKFNVGRDKRRRSGFESTMRFGAALLASSNLRSRRTRAGCVICLLLVVLAAVAQIVHDHPVQARNASHNCSICAVSHGSLQIGHLQHHAPALTSALFVLPRTSRPHCPALVSTLFIRPPPSLSPRPRAV